MKLWSMLHIKVCTLSLIISTIPLFSCTAIATTPSVVGDVVYVDQGTKWSADNRKQFYSQDQGSQIMPLKWMQALKQSSGDLFLADSLQRYGYLPNVESPTPGLPIGFTVNKQYIGMTCAACHSRQIYVNNTAYRVDGGPAIVDFQSFAVDLGKAVNTVLTDSKSFDDFAKKVLGGTPSEQKKQGLHKEVEIWNLPYSTIMDNALPKDKPWGPARLDAVGMIFNRLTGLDIGTGPDHIIKENIHLADAPVRYPFIWNAPIQDKTQWPGFADNGNDVLGLSRNLGEVIGVFAHFYPQKDDWRVLGVDYLKENSANFEGLHHLESLVKKIGPPKWPWAVDSALAAQGKKIFESKTKTEEGGCAGCHGIRPGAMRSFKTTWATPLCYVDTDTRQFNLLTWTVKTGVLAGAQIPFLDKPLLAENQPAIGVLGMAVIGSILQKGLSPVTKAEDRIKSDLEKVLGEKNAQKLAKDAAEIRKMQAKLINKTNEDLKGAFHMLKPGWQNTGKTKSICKSKFDDTEPALAFESRVMEGIWATAPYLHNGSVPTLADLLEPVAKRPAAFKIGSNYDPIKIGLAVEQTQFDYTLHTTDCGDQDSGDSRCGHEFGTKLNDSEKKALLEYLKVL